MKKNISLEQYRLERIANLCGPCNKNLSIIESALHVNIIHRGSHFYIEGSESGLEKTERLLHLFAEKGPIPLMAEDIQLGLAEVNGRLDIQDQSTSVKANHLRQVRARTSNQHDYLDAIRQHELIFGIGPAGTGKTFLAVACAIDALEKGAVERIILTRPAVEAGEKLGFLPGDMAQKADPYLRPLYDALYQLGGQERITRWFEKNIIEIAPLAYMRGRTLNEAFIILDEAQNTTCEQMKMFLTRLGASSKAAVTGDTTQIDLPAGQKSGLNEAIAILNGVHGIAFCFLETADIVRHPLVAKIVEAYQEAVQQKNHPR